MPPLPDDVSANDLDRDVRSELRSLTRETAELVARRLVMAGRLLEDDPESAYRHAMAAQRSAARVGVVREAAGLAAYAAGRFDVALSELRAARRIGGSHAHLPILADCERGLGRPEKALALAGAPEVARLDRGSQVEMRIVAAGARRDMGQLAAAIVTLAGPDLEPREPAPWTARLRYAYADALLAAGREVEARAWFHKAADVDATGATEAADRLAELDGLTFVDLEDEPDGAFESAIRTDPATGEVASAPLAPAPLFAAGATSRSAELPPRAEPREPADGPMPRPM